MLSLSPFFLDINEKVIIIAILQNNKDLERGTVAVKRKMKTSILSHRINDQKNQLDFKEICFRAIKYVQDRILTWQHPTL